MLPTLSQIGSRVPWRTIVILGLLAIAALAIPTLRRGKHTHMLLADAEQPAGSGNQGIDADGSDRGESASRGRKPPLVVEYLPRPTEAEERFLVALGMPVDVDFRDFPLEDCLRFLGEYPKLPKFTLHIDSETLKDEGMALDQPVTLKLKGCRLESAFHLLLDPAQLTVVFENDVVLVTTQAKAGEKVITRIYPVRDLFQGRERAESRNQGQKTEPSRGGFERMKKYDDLLEAIEVNIEPDSWEEMCGPGSMTYVKESSCLVIRQTLHVHREILQLLRDLREAKRIGEVTRKPAAT